jgi:hypothetical protein
MKCGFIVNQPAVRKFIFPFAILPSSFSRRRFGFTA